MGRQKRLGKLGWRWRRNPLRRRSDRVEAWLGVVVVVLFCAVPVLGWWAGASVDRALMRVVRAQRAERTLVPAVVLDPPDRSRRAVADKVGTADPRGDLLRWTAADRSVHTATVPGSLEVWHKGRLSLWTDRLGELAPPPLDRATAETHATLAGIAAAGTAGGVLVIARQVAMWRLMRRRLSGWERDWARVGQDWGRAGAGG